MVQSFIGRIRSAEKTVEPDPMKKQMHISRAAYAAALIAIATPSLAAVMVGGAPMYASKNIVQNAAKSKDHTTLVAAVKAAGLVDTLMSAGPFTVFAPVNKAFEKLPKGTVETLLKPENKDTLTAVLTYHVVAGKLSADELRAKVEAGGGKANLMTVQGENLTVVEAGRRIEILDAKGDRSSITIPDVNQSNGVIHVVDTVLLPK